MKSAPQTTALVTPESLLKHWQGHRSITRKAIEMFPEEHLFGFQPAPPFVLSKTPPLDIQRGPRTSSVNIVASRSNAR